MFNLCKASGMFAVFVIGMTLSGRAEAQSKYGPGVTDKEIRLGTTMPFSGPVSSSSLVGKAMEAYYHKINDEGGINVARPIARQERSANSGRGIRPLRCASRK